MFNCIFNDLSWNSPVPGSTFTMYTSYYYTQASPAATFSAVDPSGGPSTVKYKFDLSFNAAKIATYKLGVYNSGGLGYLVTTGDGLNPTLSSGGTVSVPNGSATVTDTFTISIIAYYTSGGSDFSLDQQNFQVSITPAWLPELTITSGSPTETSYTSGGFTYRLYRFSNAGSYTFTIGTVSDPSLSGLDLLVVGGGGGGGGGYEGGGGGGGAVISTTSTLGYCGGPTYYGLSRNPTGLGPYTVNTGTNLVPSTATVYTAVAGAGGAGAYYNFNSPYSTAPANGGASYFRSGATTLFQAIGGGAGAYEMNISSNPPNGIYAQSKSGGSGGGSSHYGPQITVASPPPYFTVLPGAPADASFGGNFNVVTINGTQYSGYTIPDPSGNNGRFGYLGGSGISSTSYTGYPNIFVGGGGGGAGGGLYGNSGDPSGGNQLFQSTQINAFNNYPNATPNGTAYVPPGLTVAYTNNYGIAGFGGDGITNSITNSSAYYAPGGGGGARVGNNQIAPTTSAGLVASNGGLGQAGYGQGFDFFTTTTPGTSYFNPGLSNTASNGNPGVPGAGGGSGCAADESNSYSGMTSGSGTAGCVIIRYRIA